MLLLVLFDLTRTLLDALSPPAQSHLPLRPPPLCTGSERHVVQKWPPVVGPGGLVGFSSSVLAPSHGLSKNGRGVGGSQLLCKLLPALLFSFNVQARQQLQHFPQFPFQSENLPPASSIPCHSHATLPQSHAPIPSPAPNPVTRIVLDRKCCEKPSNNCAAKNRRHSSRGSSSTSSSSTTNIKFRYENCAQ